jgi:hypothetical protein
MDKFLEIATNNAKAVRNISNQKNDEVLKQKPLPRLFIFIIIYSYFF